MIVYRLTISVYNKWHETELDRWLSDHGENYPRLILASFLLLTCYTDIPHPSPADRRDLENLVKTNWDTKVQKPLGFAADQANDQLHHAKEWIFDT